MTGHSMRLTDEQVALVQRLQRGQFGDVSFDPYEVGGSCWPWGWGHLQGPGPPSSACPQPAVDFFSGDLMIHPVTNRPADKRSFIPSLVEKEKVGVGHPGGAPARPTPAPAPLTPPSLQVSRMVHAIKMGWIQPRRPRDQSPNFYDLWAQEDPNAVLGRHKMHVPAPKLALPGHSESYNPPPEYLPSEEEVGLVHGGVWAGPWPGLAPGSLLPPQRLAWEQQEPEERKLSFLPRRFPSLRAVPAYGRFIQERFERCLDLYLCPRQRKMRVCGGTRAGAGSGGGCS